MKIINNKIKISKNEWLSIGKLTKWAYEKTHKQELHDKIELLMNVANDEFFNKVKKAIEMNPKVKKSSILPYFKKQMESYLREELKNESYSLSSLYSRIDQLLSNSEIDFSDANAISSFIISFKALLFKWIKNTLEISKKPKNLSDVIDNKDISKEEAESAKDDQANLSQSENQEFQDDVDEFNKPKTRSNLTLD